MMPSANLPILDPLRLIPIAGQPLYDLLQPDTRILVNLGYGSITDGWNQGPANVELPSGYSRPISTGLPFCPHWETAHSRVLPPSSMTCSIPTTYQITPLVDNPALTTLITAAYRGGDINNPHPASLWDLLASWVTTPPEPS